MSLLNTNRFEPKFYWKKIRDFLDANLAVMSRDPQPHNLLNEQFIHFSPLTPLNGVLISLMTQSAAKLGLQISPSF